MSSISEIRRQLEDLKQILESNLNSFTVVIESISAKVDMLQLHPL